MKKEYFSILETLKESDHSKSHPNDRILLIDGLNTFIRSFVVNPVVNDDGVHIGGISGFLQSIGYAIRNIKPTRVIVVFDGKGGSQRRRKLYPEYKANRRVNRRMTRVKTLYSVDDEKMAMKYQLSRLLDYLSCLPLSVLSIGNIEADDTIAYISKQLLTDSQIFIMSTDSDFLQLVDDRIKVWSPTKKKFYFADTIKEEFGLRSENYLFYKILTGDSSDNIPGIRGLGLKTLKKKLPILFEDRILTLEEIINYAEANKDSGKVLESICENKDQLLLNNRLIQLFEVDISGRAKEAITNQVDAKVNRLIKYKFQKFMLEDTLNNGIKNPELWIKDTFMFLDTYISVLNEEKDNVR